MFTEDKQVFLSLVPRAEFLSLVTIRLLGSCAGKGYDQQHDLNFSAEDVGVVFFVVLGFTVVFNRLFLGCCF